MAAGETYSGNTMTVAHGAGGATTAVHIRRWVVNLTSESSKWASNSTAGWKKTQVGVKDWAGTIEVLIHDGATMDWTISDTARETFFHADKTNLDDYFTGDIKVTDIQNIEFDAESGDPVAAEVTFEGHGTLTAAGAFAV